MTYVVRVAKKGFDVLDPKKKRKNISQKEISPHLLYSLALSYLFGAKAQLERYKFAILTYKKNSVMGTYVCLHEVSTLFEDLCTVGKYAEKCGNTNALHQLWFDVRNHIRHDIREEFDDENDPRKNKRANILKIDSRLQTDLEFMTDSIKIGGIIVEIKAIEKYLEWAEKIIDTVIDEAKKHGEIKS